MISRNYTIIVMHTWVDRRSKKCIFCCVYCDHGVIKLTQNCVCFTNPRINFLAPSSVTREYHPKVVELCVSRQAQCISIGFHCYLVAWSWKMVYWCGVSYSCIFLTEITKQNNASGKKQRHQRLDINWMLMKIQRHKNLRLGKLIRTDMQ